MKYDLIVVGGGPGGLIAAKTAAEDGLKVVLIERKRNITEINRPCCQIFYLDKLSPTGSAKDGYLDPVSIECEAHKTCFHFPVPGFSVDYSGCLRPYVNWIHISPSGYRVNRYEWNNRSWGFYLDKEAFVGELLTSVVKAGVEVLPETIGLEAENTKDGVKVRVQGKSVEKTLEARTAIAADGVASKIVGSPGLDKTREVIMPGRLGFVQYIMEGVETGLPESSWLTWTIPSISHTGNVMVGLWANNRHMVGALAMNADAVLKRFINHPKYAHMFRHAQIVKKSATVVGGRVLTPIREPVAGNVVIVGDAGALMETWIQGAVACGYQAVKAIEKELNGEKGYPEYIAWWQQAFGFNVNPPHSDVKRAVNAIYSLSGICSDDEVDYLYEVIQGKVGVPSVLIAQNIETIKTGRPKLHEKLMRVKQ